MARKSKGFSPLATAKNAVRGVVGGKNFEPLDTISAAIEGLPERQLTAFFQWVERFPAKRVRLYPPAKVLKYKDLQPREFLIIKTLPTCIRWVTSFLARNALALQKYLSQLNKFEIEYLSGEYTKAAAALDSIENEMGLSLWLINNRINFLHRSRGLESQKEYARSVHQQARYRIPGFLAFFISQRNEDSVSFERFAPRLANLIEGQKIRDEVKLHLNYLLSGGPTADADTDSLSLILSVGSAFSLIDAYETLINVLQFALRHFDSEAIISATFDATSRLDVRDWRLSKLQATATGQFHGLSFRDLKADVALLRGEYKSAIELAVAQATTSRDDIEALMVAAESLAQSDQTAEFETLSPLQRELLIHFTNLRRKAAATSTAAKELSKLAVNAGGLRISKSIGACLTEYTPEDSHKATSQSAALLYSTAYLNPAHWPFLSESNARLLLEYSRTAFGDNLVSTVAFDQMVGREIQYEEIPFEIQLELSINAALHRNNIDSALHYAERLLTSNKGFWCRFAAKIKAECLLWKGDLAAVIRCLAAYCCRDDDYRYILPLQAALGDRRWKELKHLRADIALPIALDLYWRTVDDSRHETNRRIAYDEFLRAHNCKRPTDLIGIAERFNRNELIYFLREICVPEVMDVSFDSFANSRDIEEERKTVCSLLSDLDPINKTQYSDEIRELTAHITIQEGLRDIDRSRVHVDLDAISRWAEKELSEDFSRYKELVKAGVGFGSTEEFEEAIREFSTKRDTAVVQKYLIYPEQEGADLLISMYEQIKQEYLANSDCGLDAYLSMRIRHGSLAGHLRGPLDERALIVPKEESTGSYSRNVALVHRLGIDSPWEQDTIFNAFAQFSADYDAIIEDLTKNRLHVRTTSKPAGMFALPLGMSPLGIHYIRNYIQEDTTFATFVHLVFAFISSALTPVLLAVRDYILDAVKTRIETAVETLRTSLENGTSPSTYSQLNSVIADAIPHIQAAIRRVAEWFVPAEGQRQAVARSVEEIVEIGIEATRLAHRGFAPRIESTIAKIAVRSASSLSDFTDILFTVLDNVYRHSGNKTSPWVKLNINSEVLDATHQLVVIRVDSEVARRAYSEGVVHKLDRIRELIDSGDYRKHVNLEGGTGLLKLKRLASLDPRERLQFGFSSEDSFFVEISLVMRPDYSRNISETVAA